MPSDLRAILQLEVPLIVLLGSRHLKVSEVVSLIPGAIIELPKRAEDELELMVNNKIVGTGKAVKFGENFGIRISFIGDVRARLAALGGDGGSDTSSSTGTPENEDPSAAAALAA